MKRIMIAVTVAALAGCSMTLPVQGSVQNTDESFKGTATGYMDGGGVLTIITSTGVKCTGNFAYTTGRNGQGVFSCDDRRSGPFEFVSTGTRGTGFGDLGGKRMTFTFGNY